MKKVQISILNKYFNWYGRGHSEQCEKRPFIILRFLTSFEMTENVFFRSWRKQSFLHDLPPHTSRSIVISSYARNLSLEIPDKFSFKITRENEFCCWKFSRMLKVPRACDSGTGWGGDAIERRKIFRPYDFW